MMTTNSSIDDVVSALGSVGGLTLHRAVPAATLCTYRVGGPLALLIRVETLAALAEVASVLSRAQLRVVVIGKGSNMLVADEGFDGVAIILEGDFEAIHIEDTLLSVGAAAALPITARATVSADLTGFEWAVGVPGTIGGAVRMNAGGHGSDMAASLVDVDVADLQTGDITTRSVDSLDLAYRYSNLGSHELVVQARLRLERLREDQNGQQETDTNDGSLGAELLREIVGWRREHQPGGANAGSVFTNPEGDSAGRLIDSAGLKGHRIESAEISPKHANFIQADPDGRANDVMALMIHVVEIVEARFGIRLHAETRLIGFDPEVVAMVQQSEVEIE